MSVAERIGYSELVLPLTDCNSRENWSCPSLAKILRSKNPTSLPGCTIELILVARHGCTDHEDIRMEEQVTSLSSAMWWHG